MSTTPGSFRIGLSLCPSNRGSYRRHATRKRERGDRPAAETRDPDRRPEVHRFARLWQHFSITLPEVHAGLFSAVSVSTARRSAVFRRSTSPTCCCGRTRRPLCRSRLRHTDTVHDLRRGRSGAAAPYSRDPRYGREKGRELFCADGIATTCYVGRNWSSSSFDSIRFGRTSTAATTMSNRPRATGTRGATKAHTAAVSRLQQRYKEDISRSAQRHRCRKFRSGIELTLQQAGVQIEVHHHEVATAGQNEIDMRFGTPRAWPTT